MVELELNDRDERPGGRIIDKFVGSGVHILIQRDKAGYMHIIVTDGSGDGSDYELFVNSVGDIEISHEDIKKIQS